MIFSLVTNSASKTDLQTADLESKTDLQTADLESKTDLQTADLESIADLETADLESKTDLQTADLAFGNWRLDSITFEMLLNFDAKFDDEYLSVSYWRLH